MDQLLELRDSWDTLTRSIPWCSIYLSWVWMGTWWRYLRNDKELWILTARDKEGSLAGLAPLVRSRHKCGAMTLRRLSFIGCGIAAPAHLDFLVREKDQGEIVATFLQYLDSSSKEWDILDLEALREDSLIRARILATKRCCWLEREPLKCSFVTLPPSWEIFQNEFMNRKLRKTIRYYARRLEKDFPGVVAFRSPATESELDSALDFLFENSRRVLSQAGVTSSFAHEDHCRFYGDVVRRAFRQGFLRFYQLVVDGRIIAVQQCFSFKGIFYGHGTAYDPDWGKYSPGQQLLAHVFREAVGEKAKEVDMSHGEKDYKARWANDARFNHHLLYVRNRRARMWLFGIRTYDRFLDLGRKSIPLDVRRKIGRFLGIDLSKSDLFGQQ